MKRAKIFVIASFLYLLIPASVHAEEKLAGMSALIAQNEAKVKIDERPEILREFLNQYKSPLADSAQTFIEAADRNDLDWRLVAAISGVESGFAHALPYNSYNAWGWGIYGNNVHRFVSYDVAINTISDGLGQRYIKKWGAKTVYDIGRYYAADPNWANKVMFFMNKIETFKENYAAISNTASLPLTI